MTDHTTLDGKVTAIESAAPAAPAADAPPPRPRRGLLVGAVAVPLALGAVGLSLAQPAPTPLTPVAPVAVSALQPSGAIAAKGDVAEIFGNKFILQDGTGRALVETGRAGEGGTLVAKGESVTVQGRFENGVLHATALTRADGRVEPLRPMGPRPGGLDWAKDKVGLGPTIDVQALTGAVTAADYTDVRVAGRGPRHLDVAAKGQDGKERMLHVGFDGQIREKRVF
ncbi:DNA-binding protein [Methylobacterium nonmethylotrophicum]|uniref:DNA-binding protein n=1 Tax=Methylobacterium nonmethylotrophicum TaxID=1141884 RepID=A0A4Z0NGP0_9HYPH|nr:DNA-binding protein [Methylobacterium nonmethylotrophicum]TGD94818.1 DNA-binding protein [Methylobacterium nonmethylotrophicum]